MHLGAGSDPRPTAECIGACCGCERWGIKIVRVRMSVKIDLLFWVLPYRRGSEMENQKWHVNFCISVFCNGGKILHS